MQLRVIKKYEDSKLPEKANPSDAGWDVFARSFEIKGKLDQYGLYYSSIDYIEYKTGISIYPFDIDGYNREHASEKLYQVKIIESVKRLKELNAAIDFKLPASGIIRIDDSKLKKYFTYLAPRSSISKTNLVQCNSYGLIDNGYTGELIVRYKYIPNAEDFVFTDGRLSININPDKIYKVGDKIAQLIVTQQEIVDVLETSEIVSTDRGSNGFGSSGN